MVSCLEEIKRLVHQKTDADGRLIKICQECVRGCISIPGGVVRKSLLVVLVGNGDLLLFSDCRKQEFLFERRLRCFLHRVREYLLVHPEVGAEEGAEIHPVHVRILLICGGETPGHIIQKLLRIFVHRIQAVEPRHDVRVQLFLVISLRLSRAVCRRIDADRHGLVLVVPDLHII